METVSAFINRDATNKNVSSINYTDTVFQVGMQYFLLIFI